MNALAAFPKNALLKKLQIFFSLSVINFILNPTFTSESCPVHVDYLTQRQLNTPPPKVRIVSNETPIDT